jgi:hypothetical protein
MSPGTNIILAAPGFRSAAIARLAFGCLLACVAAAACGDDDDDTTPPPRCGKVESLADAFDADVTGRWLELLSNNASLQIGGGGVAATTTADTSAGLRSAHFYDLRDSSVSLVVSQGPGNAAGAELRFGVRTCLHELPQCDSQDDGLFWIQRAGSLDAVLRRAGIETVVASNSYDPGAQSSWRISEANGSVRWETSSDGSSWSIAHETPTSAVAPLAYLVVDVVLSQTGGTSASAQVGAVNGGSPRGTFCPTELLHDDFGDGLRSLAWRRSFRPQGNARVLENGTLLVTVPPGTADDSAWYESSRLHDLSASSAAAEVVRTPGAGTLALRALSIDDEALELRIIGDQLYARSKGSDVIPPQPYAPDAHRWLRLRGDGAAVHWEASADGGEWSTLASQQPPAIDLRAVTIALGGGSVTEETEILRMGLDNFNRVPPAD